MIFIYYYHLFFPILTFKILSKNIQSFIKLIILTYHPNLINLNSRTDISHIKSWSCHSDKSCELVLLLMHFSMDQVKYFSPSKTAHLIRHLVMQILNTRAASEAKDFRLRPRLKFTYLKNMEMLLVRMTPFMKFIKEIRSFGSLQFNFDFFGFISKR